ncbi:MAG: GDP-mannose 4,6-dehydratase [Saprospiraceae bacterium]|nr:GDP-mannose 4,6-dehydratase [Saprospiraceae bacterium]
MKTALITGINGQDGSYLAELLLEKNYKVWGILKRNSVAENQTYRLDGIYGNPNLHLEYGDLTDFASLVRVLQLAKPMEVYNLAAQSHVRISFDQPIYTAQVTGVGTLNLLEAIRLVCPTSRVYQASSSEMFGNSIDADGFQRETTPLNPVSPYACAKVFSYNICRNYRNAYNMFISNGILFNHESPRRGSNFVTNKVAKEAAKIKLGLSDKLSLGNMDATRDWGHAKDYVRAMWMILQHNSADDFVCATGISHSVQDLVNYVFDYVELDPRQYVRTDKRYFRPEELRDLKGDANKAKEILGWEPEITFQDMMKEMVDYWLDYYKGHVKK